MPFKKQPHRSMKLLSPAILLALGTIASAQTGRLDFLKSKDSSFALFANTSATLQPGKQYPNELVLLTGLPFKPTISARVDLLAGVKPLCPDNGCGGLRSVAISPDGDTALVSSDPNDAQPPAVRTTSSLFLLRNLRAFVRSRNVGDLRIRTFKATEFPQLDNVSALAFGPDGRWAVVSTRGPGYIDLTYTAVRGTVVVITGLPDNPVFSAPFSVPMHSQGNIDLSLDGGTLLLNDSTDKSRGGLNSNVIVVQGIRPGGPPPRVAAIHTFETPAGFPDTGLEPVKDARLTLDGRFVLAPIGTIRAFDGQGMPIGLNQIAMLGPVRNGKLEIARLLTEADGVNGGPYQAAISPDADSALVVNALDSGGGNLLTGLGSGDPSKFKLKPLPFPAFGPPFPLGPNGPPVLAPHGEAIFTADGETALVNNWIIPPLANVPLMPSLSVLTGFHSGNIRVAANLSDPTLNPFENQQQIATAPAGLVDYLNLYLPAGPPRDHLVSILNDAIARADRGETKFAIADSLISFVLTVNEVARAGLLTKTQSYVLETLAIAGLDVINGQTENVSAAGFNPGPVSPDSIASLLGTGLNVSSATADSGHPPTTLEGTSILLIDSEGQEVNAPVFLTSPEQINYRVPSSAAAGKGIAVVLTGDRKVAMAMVDIEPVAPSLFSSPGGNLAAAAVQRVRADGTQSIESVNGPIDLGPATDQVFLILFGTGIRGRSGLSAVTATAGGQEVAVSYAGPQADFDGLDQVNLLLPRSLAGRGQVEIALGMDGWDANRVTVSIR